MVAFRAVMYIQLNTFDGHIWGGDHEIQLDCFYIEDLCYKHNSKIRKYNG